MTSRQPHSQTSWSEGLSMADMGRHPYRVPRWRPIDVIVGTRSPRPMFLRTRMAEAGPGPSDDAGTRRFSARNRFWSETASSGNGATKVLYQQVKVQRV